MEVDQASGPSHPFSDLFMEHSPMLKAAWPSDFNPNSNLISSNKHNPKTVFDTIINLVCSQPPAVPVFSINEWNIFLSFFVDKVDSIRARSIRTLPDLLPSHLNARQPWILSSPSPYMISHSWCAV